MFAAVFWLFEIHFWHREKKTSLVLGLLTLSGASTRSLKHCLIYPLHWRNMGRVWCHLMSAQHWKHHTCNTVKVTTVPLVEIHTILSNFQLRGFSLVKSFLSLKDPTDLRWQTWYVLGFGGQPQDWPLVPYLRGNWDFLWDPKCMRSSIWNLSSPTCPNLVLKKHFVPISGTPKC